MVSRDKLLEEKKVFRDCLANKEDQVVQETQEQKETQAYLDYQVLRVGKERLDYQDYLVVEETVVYQVDLASQVEMGIKEMEEIWAHLGLEGSKEMMVCRVDQVHWDLMGHPESPVEMV